MTRPYRVIFCGGRDWSAPAPIFSKLDDVLERHPGFVLVHGVGRGADLIAQALAEWMGIPMDPFPADWDGRGRGAGPERNQRMIDSGVDAVYAFKTRFDRSMRSGGTEDCVRRALNAGIPAMVIEEANRYLPEPAIHSSLGTTPRGITTRCGLELQHPSTCSGFDSSVSCEDCRDRMEMT